jgi:uncharacterized C2H2 Zn-finger protein
MQRKSSEIEVSRKGQEMIVCLEKLYVPDSITLNSFGVKQEAMSEAVVTSTRTSRNFCRCCFKSLSPLEIKYPADASTMCAYEQVTQIYAGHYQVAQFFCEECFTALQGFSKFKKVAVERQQRFDAMLSSYDSFTTAIDSFVFVLDPLKREDINDIVVREIKIEPLDEDFTPSDEVHEIKCEKVKTTKTTSRQVKSNYFLCPQCNKYVHSLTRHAINVHSLKCAHCKFKTLKQKSLDNHINKNHPLPQTCAECGIVLKNQKELAKHIKKKHRIVDADQMFKCDVCDYEATKKRLILAHLQCRHFTKDLRCMECDYATTTLKNLNHHILYRHKNGGSRPYMNVQCPTCSVMVRKQYLSDHIARVHNKIRRHKCEQCPMKFYDRTELR